MNAAQTFKHRQRVAVRRLLGPTFAEDWSETATVLATKRDLRPMGYWVVRFDDGSSLCIPAEQLRAIQ